MKDAKGNALFLILIAVALFAALSYAVTNSGRGGSGADKEKSRLAASEILQWFGIIDATMNRMKITGRFADENISFNYDTKYYNGTDLNDYMDNPNCVSDDCKVFNPLGGGLSAPDFSNYATTDPTSITAWSLEPGNIALRVIQWPGAGTSANDIAIRVAFMKPDICVAINNIMDISAIPVFDGTFNQSPDPANWDNPGNTISANDAEITNKFTFASDKTGSGSGEFCDIYHLVFAR